MCCQKPPPVISNGKTLMFKVFYKKYNKIPITKNKIDKIMKHRFIKEKSTKFYILSFNVLVFSTCCTKIF